MNLSAIFKPNLNQCRDAHRSVEVFSYVNCSFVLAHFTAFTAERMLLYPEWYLPFFEINNAFTENYWLPLLPHSREVLGLNPGTLSVWTLHWQKKNAKLMLTVWAEDTLAEEIVDVKSSTFWLNKGRCLKNVHVSHALCFNAPPIMDAGYWTALITSQMSFSSFAQRIKCWWYIKKGLLYYDWSDLSTVFLFLSLLNCCCTVWF